MSAKKKTAIQKMISEFEEIKSKKCKTLQEVMFFDGILAIIESKYLEKEKKMIINAVNQNEFFGEKGFGICEDTSAGEQYYEATFQTE